MVRVVKFLKVSTTVLVGALAAMSSGCSFLQKQDEIRIQLPLYTWADQYVVDAPEIRTSGIFCAWPETRCNAILGNVQYEVSSGRWTNAKLVEIQKPGIQSEAVRPVPYDIRDDACLTDPELKNKPCSPNWYLSADTSDPYYSEVEPNLRQIRARRWVNHPRPEGPIVAVIDTGIDYMHEDLFGQVVGCYNAITDKEDNCYDDNGHGTHVAGTVGSGVNNHIGITGVAPTARLQAVKFLGADGSGSLYNAIRAIGWAAKHGAKILNNSWGGSGYSEPLGLAIRRAKDAGIIFIAAAGNSGRDADLYPSYPAAYEESNVISVAAVDSNDTLAPFSNYGKASVDVAAPGVQVFSTKAGGGYHRLSGTSMAAPHVSGVAAAILTKYPTASIEEVRNRIGRVRRRKKLGKIRSSGVVNLNKALR